MDYSEKQIRQNKITMRECVDGLGVYAALMAIDNSNTSTVTEIRNLINDLVPYWGLDIGDDSKPLDDYLHSFDNMVDDAVRNGWIEPDHFTACYNTLTGLAQYGEDLVGSQGNDAMKEILKIGDLLSEAGEYFGYHHEKIFADDSAKWLRNTVKGMLNDYDLPGSAIEGESNVNYVIKQAVLYDNNMGFAFAHNTAAVSPFVTWQMYSSNGKLGYEAGNYFSSEEKAIVDYITRTKEYAGMQRVTEIKMPGALELTRGVQDTRDTQKAGLSKPNELKIKLWLEYTEFINKLQKLPPEQIVERSYEKVCKEEIVIRFENQNYLSEANAQMLLSEDVTLDDLYNAWLKADSNLGETIEYCIDDYIYRLGERNASQSQEQDEQRLYKAEISNPDEPESPSLEVFHADDDVDAVRYAYDYCDNYNKDSEPDNHVFLLEVHELNENYDSIREIDLRYHDPEAHRYMDVNLIKFLGKIADKTIIQYPEDWAGVAMSLPRIADADNPEHKSLMLQISSYGTHFFTERDTFIKDTPAYNYRTNYREKDPDMLGFVIEVTGNKNGAVTGNVYDVGDYYSHAQYIKETALIMDSVSLKYADDMGINAGKTITMPKYEYDNDRHRLMSESGHVISMKYHPSESSRKMTDLLQAEQARRMAMPVGDTQEYLEKLDKKLAEIRDIPWQTQGEPQQENQQGSRQDEQRIYHADFSDPQIPERMEIIWAKDDAHALEQANEICGEAKGILLLELKEVDNGGNERWVSIDRPPIPTELMPDPSITTDERNAYGYTYHGILPLNQDRALDLYMQDKCVFLLWADNSESMVNDSSEIMVHDGIFGIELGDWQKTETYKELTSKGKIADEKEASAQNTRPESREKPEKTIKPRKPYRGTDR